MNVLSQYLLSQGLLLGDMCTLPVSAQVATMWPACGMARTRFTPPGCVVAFDLTDDRYISWRYKDGTIGYNVYAYIYVYCV